MATILNYSCTSPLPVGQGNIASDPQLADEFHLAVTSPCRSAGNPLAVSGTDLDGEAWLNPPSMGCDEATEASLVGPLSVFIEAAQDTLLVNRMLSFTGHVTGLCARLHWNFGDGPAVTNASYLTSHTWTNAGDYSVTLTAFNADNPAGVTTNLLVHVLPVEPPAATVLGLNGTNFQLQFNSQATASYWVEYATDLTPPITWLPVKSLTGDGGTVQVTDAFATNEARFYRVRAQ
jgi:hypothetical protein